MIFSVADKREYKMKSEELERIINELNKRVLQMNEELELINSNVERFDERLKVLSDELYGYIDSQNSQLTRYVDNTSDNLGNRIQSLSNNIYEYVEGKKSACDNALSAYSRKVGKDNWILEFYYDRMISGIQMHMIEQVCPGNRTRLKALRDTHMGERCFIIGNGPSLMAKDLDQIKEKGIFTFASKGIYKIFNETNWRPDAWGASDLDYIEIKKDEINKLKGFIKLVCAQSVITQGILIEDAIYYPFIQAERYPKCFNRDILDGVHFYGTITGKLINIAVYMGFKEIYLLGCDNTLPTKIDESGKKVIDTSGKLHFSQDYYSDADEENKAYRNVDADKIMKYVCDSYKDIKYFCEMYGVKIYNATRGGTLETFPRVDFDNVL